MAEDIELFHVDDTYPVIEKTVGDPNCYITEDMYCVRTDTVITIDAYDLGCCENLTVKYSINKSAWIDITDLIPFDLTFGEECVHTLDIWAYDCLGHEVYDNETFYVDDTPPNSWKLIDGPHYNASQEDIDLFGLEGGEIEFFWLRDKDTWVEIDAEDQGIEPCIAGLDYIHIELWWDSNHDNIIETKLWEENVYGGSFSFQIMEDCLHQIRWYAVDLLGNKEETHYQLHRVDSTPPESVKIFDPPGYPEDLNENGSIEPEEENYWVTSETEITIAAIDHAAPCAVGVKEFYVKVWWDSDCDGFVDTELFNGSILDPYSFTFTFRQLQEANGNYEYMEGFTFFH
jgi:hypothetical protein